MNNGEGNLLRGRRERNNASTIINSPTRECQSLISALMLSCNCFRPLQAGTPYNAHQKTFGKWKEQNVTVVLPVLRTNLYLFQNPILRSSSVNSLSGFKFSLHLHPDSGHNHHLKDGSIVDNNNRQTML